MSQAEQQDALEDHYGTVVNAFRKGRVIPFLGAGANLCERPEAMRDQEPEKWEPTSGFLPSGAELAAHLRKSQEYRDQDGTDLTRVAQRFWTMAGEGPLYEELRLVFTQEYQATRLHRLLATALPQAVRSAPRGDRGQLIVTTNYDDLLERAFIARDEPFDTLVYEAKEKEEHRGRFWHVQRANLPEGKRPAPVPIVDPVGYSALPLDRTVILKIHGAVNRVDHKGDSFVITEDDYIQYLAHTDLTKLPSQVSAWMARSNFLFLGYSLRDWNLRAMLQRVWDLQSSGYRAWAILRSPNRLDRNSWTKRDVDVYDIDLATYVAEVERRLFSPN